jgi:Xaa-Pro aminopeptidase
MPHAKSGDRRLKRGEHILVDAGSVYGGYNSDLTRVFNLSKISKKLSILKDIYEIVKEAKARAISEIAPGARCSDVDRAAREFIKEEGFADNFRHSLGHGLGLEVHELPVIKSDSDCLLRPGMVFTVEPGIYIENLGGIRLEDMVVVTDNSRRILD